jgi:hypothetical protein
MKQFKNPEEFLKVSKKGKTLMIFVKVGVIPEVKKELFDFVLTSETTTGLYHKTFMTALI